MCILLIMTIFKWILIVEKRVNITSHNLLKVSCCRGKCKMANWFMLVSCWPYSLAKKLEENVPMKCWLSVFCTVLHSRWWHYSILGSFLSKQKTGPLLPPADVHLFPSYQAPNSIAMFICDCRIEIEGNDIQLIQHVMVGVITECLFTELANCTGGTSSWK